MNLDSWIVIAILAGAVILFVTEWLRVDVVALGVVVLLLLSGILTTAEALSGFSNPAVLTIASLFIVGGAVLQTGLAGRIGRRILSVAGTSENRLTIVLIAAVALMSSFMSDTGTVAVLLPAVIVMARSVKISPSKLLIPLSIGSLLGGATTLIGTPPNIIVSDLLRESGAEPFTFFSFTPMGVALIVVGLLYMVLIGRKLLPDRGGEIEGQRIETPEEIVTRYRLPDDMFRLRVRRGSKLVGSSLAESDLGARYRVTVMELLRRESPRGALRLSRPRATAAEAQYETIVPQADTKVVLDDLLLVRGNSADVAQLAAAHNLALQPADASDHKALVTEEVGVGEVLLPASSSLLGKSIADLKFGSRYNLSVLGLKRPGTQEPSDLKETQLQFGDILLVQGTWTNIIALKEFRRDFVVMGQPAAMLAIKPSGKAAVAAAILVGMLALSISGLTSLTTATMAAGLAMVLTGCLSMDQAYRAIDWKSVVLVAGMLPMSLALDRVGLVDVAAQGLVDVLGGIGPLAVLAGLFLLTTTFTQLLSNTATTVVVAPIALAAAGHLGVAPHAFLMAVAIAASMAFATPVASPVNTLVMGAGDYRFGDYAKVGIPLIVLALVTCLALLPIIFPM